MILIVWIFALFLMLAGFIAAGGLIAGLLVAGLRTDRTLAERGFRCLLVALLLLTGYALLTANLPLVAAVAMLLTAACAVMLVLGACRAFHDRLME